MFIQQMWITVLVWEYLEYSSGWCTSFNRRVQCPVCWRHCPWGDFVWRSIRHPIVQLYRAHNRFSTWLGIGSDMRDRRIHFPIVTDYHSQHLVDSCIMRKYMRRSRTDICRTSIQRRMLVWYKSQYSRRRRCTVQWVHISLCR